MTPFCRVQLSAALKLSAKQVINDPDFKTEHSEIEWRKIIGTRHKLIHDYFGVDYDIVWDVITNKLPDLLDYIEQIIEE
nr:HepT-like ribonuclease domain-containing protein [Arachidicoccus sp. BS20]